MEKGAVVVRGLRGGASGTGTGESARAVWGRDVVLQLTDRFDGAVMRGEEVGELE